MSIFFIVMGATGIVGGLLHIVLGERFIIRPLDSQKLGDSFLGDGDVTKRYLRWFWHVGSIAIVGPSVALVSIGWLETLSANRELILGIATQFSLMFCAFLLIAVPRPELFYKVPQGLLLGFGGLLIWLIAD